MIAGIKGILISATPISAIINVGGLFYELNIPLTTAEKLPNNGQELFLHTVAVYREDSQALYGFASKNDKEFFKTLIEKVSGIGPKTAINIMSRMSVQTLQNAIANGDIALLSKCPGIGKKTAERLIVELRDASFSPTTSETIILSPEKNLQSNNNISDAISALVALGFKLADADKAVRKTISSNPSLSTEEIVKNCLRS